MEGGVNTRSLPKLSVVAAALRKTTEALAVELAAPSGQAPAWNDFEWRVARAALAIHGVAPLLAGRLRWHGPEGWDEHLQRQRRHVEARQQRIAALLLRIDTVANGAGLPLLALKGAALHRQRICRAGERPMGDIDLLVHPRHVEGASSALQSLGYVQTGTTWRHRIFEAGDVPSRDEFGELPDSAIKIELHSHIAERLPATPVDITGLLLIGNEGPGLIDYPNRASLMHHLLLHAAGNMASKWLRLLQLHDIALLAGVMTEPDWQRLLQPDNSAWRSLWWAYPPLRMAMRYLAAPVPQQVAADVRSQCHPWLRWMAERGSLTDVSSSSLWVRAAPGIPWAGSLPELTRYLARRVRPPGDELAVIGGLAAQQRWSAEGRWYSMKQHRRIWQWLTARPARPQILHAVRLAGK